MTKIWSKQSKILWLLGTVFIGWTALSLRDSAYGQQIQADSTLGAESSVITSGVIINNNSSELITAGAIRGANLFHSFEEFNINSGQRVYFNNPTGVERIIARVTGSGNSTILGRLGIIGGTADLFLLNPNGIIFGQNATLDLKGSFLATTASNYIFPDSEYSAIEPSSFPILSVNIPIGLRFGDTAGEIVNRSRASDPRRVGLQVVQGQTLALIGGKITMEGGGLTAPEGRIELVSIAGAGQVPLREGDWAIEYEGIQNPIFGDINLLQKAFAGSRGNNGASINLYGKDIKIADGSFLFSTVTSGLSPSLIKIKASDSFELVGESNLVTSSFGNATGGNVQIDAKKIFLRDRAYIQTASSFIGSIIASGQSGDISIVSDQLEISGGAYLNASTLGMGRGGNISIDSSDYVSIFGVSQVNGTPSGIYSISENDTSGSAGTTTINTQFLRISDRAALGNESFGKGSSGRVEVNAQSIVLDNKASISVKSTGAFGNIELNSNDIILRDNSKISADVTGGSSGGNIVINTDVLTALENSDITANSTESFGGRVIISARRIFGTEYRLEPTSESDITASSDLGPDFSGTVELNITAVDPNQGLIELPETVVDPKSLVSQNACRQTSSSEFTRSGRGGLPPSLSQDLNGKSTLVGLVEPANLSAAKPEPQPTSTQVSSLPLSSSQIAPAQGWVYNDKGEVVLVAYNSAVTGPQRLQSDSKGCPVF
jgi:filamentous hemagglutinin family protein